MNKCELCGADLKKRGEFRLKNKKKTLDVCASCFKKSLDELLLDSKKSILNNTRARRFEK